MTLGHEDTAALSAGPNFISGVLPLTDEAGWGLWCFRGIPLFTVSHSPCKHAPQMANPRV